MRLFGRKDAKKYLTRPDEFDIFLEIVKAIEKYLRWKGERDIDPTYLANRILSRLAEKYDIVSRN